MSLISWLRDKFGTASIPVNGFEISPDDRDELLGEVFIREMAFWSAVNLVSNAVGKCEFKTFSGDKEVRGPEYYLWNVEPNRNQNSSGFIQKWISQLYRHNEALIIEQNGQLLVADSFTRTPYALYDDLFTQVTVGDFTFSRSYAQSEVLYFELTQKDMRKVIGGLYESYSKLITYSMIAYRRSRGTKGVFKYDTLPVAGTAERTAFDALVNDKIKKWLTGDNAALPLGQGLDWKTENVKTYSAESTRDIRAMIDDVNDFTAKGFGIPPALLRGDVQGTSDAVDQLLTFCIDPLVDRLAEEINRKRYGRAAFLRGDYLRIDTKAIKHVDLLSVSTSIDKLISSGAFCVNDIRKLVGEPVIDEPWAWQHWMTKNYAVADLMAALNGGETK